MAGDLFHTSFFGLKFLQLLGISITEIQKESDRNNLIKNFIENNLRKENIHYKTLSEHSSLLLEKLDKTLRNMEVDIDQDTNNNYLNIFRTLSTANITISLEDYLMNCGDDYKLFGVFCYLSRFGNQLYSSFIKYGGFIILQLPPIFNIAHTSYNDIEYRQHFAKTLETFQKNQRSLSTSITGYNSALKEARKWIFENIIFIGNANTIDLGIFYRNESSLKNDERKKFYDSVKEWWITFLNSQLYKNAKEVCEVINWTPAVNDLKGVLFNNLGYQNKEDMSAYSGSSIRARLNFLENMLLRPLITQLYTSTEIENRFNNLLVKDFFAENVLLPNNTLFTKLLNINEDYKISYDQQKEINILNIFNLFKKYPVFATIASDCLMPFIPLNQYSKNYGHLSELVKSQTTIDAIKKMALADKSISMLIFGNLDSSSSNLSIGSSNNAVINKIAMSMSTKSLYAYWEYIVTLIFLKKLVKSNTSDAFSNIINTTLTALSHQQSHVYNDSNVINYTPNMKAEVKNMLSEVLSSFLMTPIGLIEKNDSLHDFQLLTIEYPKSKMHLDIFSYLLNMIDEIIVPDTQDVKNLNSLFLLIQYIDYEFSLSNLGPRLMSSTTRSVDNATNNVIPYDTFLEFKVDQIAKNEQSQQSTPSYYFYSSRKILNEKLKFFQDTFDNDLLNTVQLKKFFIYMLFHCYQAPVVLYVNPYVSVATSNFDQNDFSKHCKQTYFKNNEDDNLNLFREGQDSFYYSITKQLFKVENIFLFFEALGFSISEIINFSVNSPNDYPTTAKVRNDAFNKISGAMQSINEAVLHGVAVGSNKKDNIKDDESDFFYILEKGVKNAFLSQIQKDSSGKARGLYSASLVFSTRNWYLFNPKAHDLLMKKFNWPKKLIDSEPYADNFAKHHQIRLLAPSGSGKTTYVFGRKNNNGTIEPGIISGLFDLNYSLRVYDFYCFSYANEDSIKVAFKNASLLNLKTYITEEQTIGYVFKDCVDYTNGEEFFFNNANEIVDFAEKISAIKKKMNRIIATENNPESSRSITVFVLTPNTQTRPNTSSTDPIHTASRVNVNSKPGVRVFLDQPGYENPFFKDLKVAPDEPELLYLMYARYIQSIKFPPIWLHLAISEPLADPVTHLRVTYIKTLYNAFFIDPSFDFNFYPFRRVNMAFKENNESEIVSSLKLMNHRTFENDRITMRSEGAKILYKFLGYGDDASQDALTDYKMFLDFVYASVCLWIFDVNNKYTDDYKVLLIDPPDEFFYSYFDNMKYWFDWITTTVGVQNIAHIFNGVKNINPLCTDEYRNHHHSAIDVAIKMFTDAEKLPSIFHIFNKNEFSLSHVLSDEIKRCSNFMKSVYVLPDSFTILDLKLTEIINKCNVAIIDLPHVSPRCLSTASNNQTLSDFFDLRAMVANNKDATVYDYIESLSIGYVGFDCSTISISDCLFDELPADFAGKFNHFYRSGGAYLLKPTCLQSQNLINEYINKATMFMSSLVIYYLHYAPENITGYEIVDKNGVLKPNLYITDFHKRIVFYNCELLRSLNYPVGKVGPYGNSIFLNSNGHTSLDNIKKQLEGIFANICSTSLPSTKMQNNTISNSKKLTKNLYTKNFLKAIGVSEVDAKYDIYYSDFVKNQSSFFKQINSLFYTSYLLCSDITIHNPDYPCLKSIYEMLTHNKVHLFSRFVFLQISKKQYRVRHIRHTDYLYNLELNSEVLKFLSGETMPFNDYSNDLVTREFSVDPNKFLEKGNTIPFFKTNVIPFTIFRPTLVKADDVTLTKFSVVQTQNGEEDNAIKIQSDKNMKWWQYMSYLKLVYGLPEWREQICLANNPKLNTYLESFKNNISTKNQDSIAKLKMLMLYLEKGANIKILNLISNP